MNRRGPGLWGMLTALGLVGAGAVVWTGCGPGDTRYYCENGSCYECDGYGCNTVPPRDPPDDPRFPGVDAGELNVPGNDASVGPIVHTDGAVSKPDAGPTCAGGPCSCTRSSECANGDVCAGGVCTAPANTCKFKSDCAAGKACVNGQCVATCGDAGVCSGGTCNQGVCQPTPPTNTCTAMSCTGGTKCVAGGCVPSCTGASPTECGAGKYCNGGGCVPDTRPVSNCTATSSTCGTNQQCVQGFCRYTCGNDQTCKLIDARIGYCSNDGVCRSEAEARPQCTTQGDCTGGKSCIDNVCR